MSTPDRTKELSFEHVDSDCVETLLHCGVVVMKDKIPADALGGIEEAYRADRRKILPRRMLRRAMFDLHIRHNKLYRALEAPDVEADPYALPKHLQSAEPAINAGLWLNSDFWNQEEITDTYGGYKPINLARFALSVTEQAFPVHQDNRGKSGLGYAAQTAPTTWSIHEHRPQPPVPVEFTFTTEPGDFVTLMERRGPCPDMVPFRQGESEFFADGSRIHSGMVYTGEPRGGLGLFHLELAETKVQ